MQHVRIPIPEFVPACWLPALQQQVAANDPTGGGIVCKQTTVNATLTLHNPCPNPQWANREARWMTSESCTRYPLQLGRLQPTAAALGHQQSAADSAAINLISHKFRVLRCVCFPQNANEKKKKTIALLRSFSFPQNANEKRVFLRFQKKTRHLRLGSLKKKNLNS